MIAWLSKRNQLAYRDRREYKAKVPPSPWSSALSTIKQYLIVTIKKKDQMMSDRTPTRSSYEGSATNVDE
jgi:hypothetical protein